MIGFDTTSPLYPEGKNMKKLLQNLEMSSYVLEIHIREIDLISWGGICPFGESGGIQHGLGHRTSPNEWDMDSMSGQLHPVFTRRPPTDSLM